MNEINQTYYTLEERKDKYYNNNLNFLFLWILVFLSSIPITGTLNNIWFSLTAVVFIFYLCLLILIQFRYAFTFYFPRADLLDVLLVTMFFYKNIHAFYYHSHLFLQISVDSLPFLFLFILKTHFSALQKQRFNQLFYFFYKLSIYMLPLMFIIYFLGYNEFYPSITKILILVPKGTEPYPNSFSWWWGHKARMGIYMLSFIYMSHIFSKNKIEFALVCAGALLIVYFTNSITSFVLVAIYVFILQYKKVASYLKNIKIFTTPLLFMIGMAVILLLYQKVNQERNIFSLGGRYFLWGLAINDLLQDPIKGRGEIKMFFTEKEIKMIKETKNIHKIIGTEAMQLLRQGGSHNNFLQEGRISGSISMLLLILIYFLLFFKIPPDFKIIYFMILFFLMIEVVLTTHFVYYLFAFLSFVLVRAKHYL